MIKTLAIFPLQAAQNSHEVMTAVAQSVNDAGIRIMANSMDCDAALIWSVLWNGRMKPNRLVYEHYRQQGRPVFVVDVGALRRGVTWKIAVNHLTAQGYYGHQQDLDPDRPRRLGLSLRDNDTVNPRILIAAQHDLSLQMENTGGAQHWIQQQISRLRDVTDRPIVVRPHPRSPLHPRAFRDFENVKFQIPRPMANTYDEYDLNFEYHAVINHNSGVGIKSAISGTRTMVDASSLAHPVSISIDDLERPYEVDREQWLIEISHTEYTVDEITQGIWLRRLKEKY